MENKEELKNAITVESVSMHFNMATEKVDSLRDYLTKALSRKLFFDDFVAVDNVSFNVKKGEVFGIVGTNGSGKSTLLKMIAGVLEPTKGEIHTHGTMAPLIELGAGFDGELTGRENIYLNGALLGYSKEFLDEKFKSIVDFAEMWKFLDMPLKNYSSGMTARIAFAIATAVKPDILIADEILAVGDFLFQQKCEQRIKELMEGGTTVLIVSHSIDQIEKLCDRVLWIEKGKQYMLGKTFEVCNAYRNLQNDSSRAVKKEYQIIAREKCGVCGYNAEFRNEPGMTYKTEAYCSSCGALLRTSDLVKKYLEKEFGYKAEKAAIDNISLNLENMNIFFWGNNDPLATYLKQYSGFFSYKNKEIRECTELFLGDTLREEGKGKYDLIIMQRLLSYVEKPDEILDLLYSLLKVGGCLLLNLPIFEQKKTYIRQNKDKKISIGNNTLTTEWGNDTKSILEKHGFEVEMDQVRQWYDVEDISDIDKQYQEFIETHPYYFFKFNSWVIVAKKNIL